jgi:hypothetical protein
MSENAQSVMMTDFINEISKIQSWVGPVFWYSVVDINGTSADPEGHFGIIRADKTFKPAYYTLLNSTK